MFDQYLHAYETLSLSTVGIIMGGGLALGHLIALLKSAAVRSFLQNAHRSTLLGQALLGLDMIWIMLLLLKQDWNPLCIELYEFEGVRSILFILCPIIWFVFSSMIKENLFPRALGLFIILVVCVPLSAAFLQEPLTRLLIPIWCYPVLTLSMFWVAKPYLFRNEMAWLCARPSLFNTLAALGLLYALAILSCALLYW